MLDKKAVGKRSKNPDDRKDASITARISYPVREWLEDLARSTGHSVSWHLQNALEQVRTGSGQTAVDLAGLREEWQLRVDQKTREVEVALAEVATLRAELTATKKTVEVLEKSLDDTRAALADTRGEKDRAWGMVAEATASASNLSARERELLEVYPRLPAADQRHILDTARDLADHRQKTRGTPHKSADDPPRKDKSDRPRA